jgi:hypothetical protein
MTKQEILDLIESSGCKMLQGKLEGDETKQQILAYLRKCDCPVIKKYL